MAAPSKEVPDRILVLVGRTGNGKSTTGNSILGRDTFFADVSPSSVTQQYHVGRGQREGKNLIIVDTPGMFDTQKGLIDRLGEINGSLQAAGPGVHGLLLVLRVDRFTVEENQTVAMLVSLFGHNSLKHTIVVFTNTAKLKDKSLETFISENTNLKAIVENCNNRFVGIENKEENSGDTETSVKAILDRVDEVSNNGKIIYIPAQNDRVKEVFEKYNEMKDEVTAAVSFVDIVAEIRNQMMDNLQALAIKTEQLSAKEEKEAVMKELEQQLIESNKKLANWKVLGLAVLLTGGIALSGVGAAKYLRAPVQVPTGAAIQKLELATAPLLVEKGKQTLEMTIRALTASKLGSPV